MGIFKDKANIILISIMVLIIGWGVKVVYFPSPESEKIRGIAEEVVQKQNEYNKAWSNYILGEGSDSLKNDPATDIQNIRCFNENKACFFAVILDFSSKPSNYEEVIKKYTQELAQAKAKIYTDFPTLTLTVVGKFSESEGYKCRVDRVRSQNGQPSQYSPQCTQEVNLREF